MQLIFEADNSDINIKEKMTTVEDSIDKLMNGVAKMEESPESVNLANLAQKNSLNEESIIENNKDTEKDKGEVHVPLCDDISDIQNPEEKKMSNLNTENDSIGNSMVESKMKIEAADKSMLIDVRKPLNENASKSNNLGSGETTSLETENGLNKENVSEIQKHIESEHKTLTQEELKLSSDTFEINISSASDLDNEKNLKSNVIKNKQGIETGNKTLLVEAPALHCEFISENKNSKPNHESDVILKIAVKATEIKCDEESCVDKSEVTAVSSYKHEEKKSKEGFKGDLNNLKEQDPNENKLEENNPNNISIKSNQDNDGIGLSDSSSKLCEKMENQNVVTKQTEKEVSSNSENIDKNNDSYIVEDHQIAKSEGIENQGQERSLKDVCIENENSDKLSDSVSEKLPENKAIDIQTAASPVMDNTALTTVETISTSEKSDSKKADMECDEVVSLTKSTNSVPPTIENNRDNLDLNIKENIGNLLENVGINQIATKENTQVDKTSSCENETTTEASEKVMENINERREIKENDTSNKNESTVLEKMDTSEENVILTEKEVLDTLNKSTSDFNNEKETVKKENSATEALSTDSSGKDVNSDIEEVKVIDIDQDTKNTAAPVTSKIINKPTAVVKLSNTLNILSDDEDEPPQTQETQVTAPIPNDSKQCINIEDDDDVMVIEETPHLQKPESVSSESTDDKKKDLKSDIDTADGKLSDVLKETEPTCNEVKESTEPQLKLDDSLQTKEKISDEPSEEIKKEQPLLPKDLFKSYKKNLTEMTRDDLEEFCILKIVESIIDRSSLNEIKTKLKTMAQTIEEYKKKAMMLTKQNRDLQVVLKSIQEEQKKGGDSPIVPLKITRSVGMQVLMTDKNARRKVMPVPSPGPSGNVNNRPARNINQSPRLQTPVNAMNQPIPVPRLVPATNNATAIKAPNPIQNTAIRNPAKLNNSIPNGVKNSPPAPKSAEKRGRTQSITVDLTDDEPPPKVPAPPVRVVSSQNLLTPRAQMASNTLNNPRKVYIPIGSNQNPNVRPGQTIMLKNVPNTSGPRPRGAAPMATRAPTPNQIRMSRIQGRHPAPLPDAVKQYQPPNWKALPPAPDLKLSKVENGIVISWKIDGYQEDSYEEIASYQLYAYQETSSPPNTSLWKKIGDVKALPLPMACTLTQFMAGYKYYFAVRAVDIRSRLGPFSLPGSILLLNKM